MSNYRISESVLSLELIKGLTKRKMMLSRFIDCIACSTTKIFPYAIKLIIWTVINLMATGICLATESKKADHILYINSYAPGYSWSDGIQKGIIEHLELSNKKNDLSIEYLDSQRFPIQTIQAKVADMMFSKYAKYRHDLVIVSDNAAFDFAIKYREHLFPDIPIVFCGYNNFRPEVLRGLSNITGVNEEMDIEGLIETASYIQPKLGTLAFIISTGDVSNKLIAEKLEASILPRYRDQYEIVVLKDAPMSKIREKISRLPRESALFLMGKTSDMGDGRVLSESENGYLISAGSPIPIYTLWSFHLDTGVLGGQILAGYDQGRAAAIMALQILNGKKADSIPVLVRSPFQKIFDYNVMQKFNIGSDVLPDNSIIINKPFSFFEAYKKTVLGALGAFAILTVFIIALSINIFQKNKAEKELQKYRDHLEDLVGKRTTELTESNKGLQNALNEINILSGMLPICASCKKIRDDKGYWNQIESYIQKHTEAKFSHGMCPECSEKLYGDEEWYIKMKKKNKAE